VLSRFYIGSNNEPLEGGDTVKVHGDATLKVKGNLLAIGGADGNSGTFNRLMVYDGGCVMAMNVVAGQTVISHGNSIFIGNASSLICTGYVYVGDSGRANTLTVSNGTLEVRNTQHLYVGYNTTASNNTFVVQGETSKVRLSGNLYLRHLGALQFDVPKKGYSSEVQPVIAVTNSIANTGDYGMAVNATEWRNKTGGRQDLLRIGTGNQAMLSNLVESAVLKDLSLKDILKYDANNIWLDAPVVSGGTVILVR